MGPEDLATLLSFLPADADERLLVGLSAPDDAAVYRLDAERALVATLDFFTPLVDDPEDFGAVAAANALSDLYAMRASPIFALNVLAVPAGELPPEVTGGILRGAREICREAGIPIAGGHSIDDPEPKFGLVALGLAHPDRLYRKAGARPGDAIVLGKALGTGVVTTGIKRETAPPAAVAAAVASMRQLNRRALEISEAYEVHGATDVSGFGLLGHLREMCRASGLGARVSAAAPCLLEGARELAAAGCVPGGTERNRDAVEAEVGWAAEVAEPMRLLLVDAQTSGGLLFAAEPSGADDLVAELGEAGYAASRIGAFEPADTPLLRVEA